MNVMEWVYFMAASWYLAYVISNSVGPFRIFVLIRHYLPLGGLTTCIICLMPWIAFILHTIGHNPFTDALAIAGGALWVHGFTSWRMNL